MSKKYLKPDFNTFLNSQIQMNLDLSNIINWDKIFNKMDFVKKDGESYKDKLLNLNFLISTNYQELDKKIEILFKKNPKDFTLLYDLLSIRGSNYLEDNTFNPYSLSKLEDIQKIIYKSKLSDVFINVKDIYSYVLGIEVGLASNGRKNISGSKYEKSIEELIKSYEISYKSKVKVTDIGNIKKKIVDFFLNIDNEKYLVEVNFYNTGGSKPDSVCGQHKLINKESANSNYNFVWVTDGKGWKSAKSGLEDAYNNIELLFNYKTFGEWLNSKKTK